MKLLTFRTDAGAHVGAAVAEGVVDLTTGLRATHPNVECAHSLLAIIESGIDIDMVGNACLDALRRSNTLTQHLVARPQWLPPIPRPPKILALALNYREHINENAADPQGVVIKLDFHEEPIVFAKYSCNLVPHEAEIELPPFPQLVEEEHELALVVGRNCRHIRPSEAKDYIFGYTICNDVSARDRQIERLKMGQPYGYAKNFATFCPMGPWIATQKEIGNVLNLSMRVRVNGEVRRSGNSSAMIFNPYEVLAYCSDYTLMEAGDIISLGTFAGKKRLQAGDVVELEVDGLGTLRNRVVASRTPWRNFTMDKPTGPLVREPR